MMLLPLGISYSQSRASTQAIFIAHTLRSLLWTLQEDENDVYYFLHKKLDDNFDVICTLERQLMVETADREKAETEYIRQIEDLNHRRDEELEPLREKLAAIEKQVSRGRGDLKHDYCVRVVTRPQEL